MNRRDLIVWIGAGAIAPFLSLAQQPPRVWRIGFLLPRARPASNDADPVGGFLRGMRELGYVEGNNLVIEWRYADGKYERLPSLATELIKLNVDLIVAITTPSTRAVQRATKSIPIVMAAVADPVGAGLVASLARPGGNTSGIAILTGETSKKQIEVLIQTLPKLSRVAVLMNPENESMEAMYGSVHAASKSMQVRTFPARAQTPEEVERAFSLLKKDRAEALVVLADPFFLDQRGQIADLAAKARLPAIYAQPQYAEAGGLMSYGVDLVENLRRAAGYVDRIFKGAKPADLPVEQPTKFELVINMKIAKALGLVIPGPILARADRVIE